MNSVENKLVALLPRVERQRLQRGFEPVDLLFAQVVGEAGSATAHVYFPSSGFISLVSTIDQRPGVEVGMIGSEGMLGAELALGVATSPLHAVVQGAGVAWRMDAALFRAELAASPVLNSAILRYLYVLMSQAANSAACLRFHLIGPRLARWLLMTRDRAHSDEFKVTHEFLAYMLGVRRVGVTAAAVVMAKAGLIEYHRGSVRVVDRPGLEAAACSCYGADLGVYTRLFQSRAPKKKGTER